MWKDANGVALPGITTDHNADSSEGSMWLMDEAGYVWRLNPATLEITVAIRWPHMQLWESSDCSGTTYLATLAYESPVPRFTFQDVTDGSIRVRHDAAQELTVQMCANDPGGGCNPVAPCPQPISALLLTDTTVIPPADVPDLSGYQAPLHPELL